MVNSLCCRDIKWQQDFTGTKINADGTLLQSPQLLYRKVLDGMTIDNSA